MANNLESRTGEYVIRLRARGRVYEREWIIELEFLAKGKGKAVLHTERHQVRAEGVFYFLRDNSLLALRLAEQLIEQENFIQPEESEGQ